MPNRYWSDLHLGHDNIRTYCNRPFETTAAMDDAIVAAWRASASPYRDDPVYCLGDVALWNRCSMRRIQSSPLLTLDVPKMALLVLGNHDSQAAQTAGHYAHLCERVVGDPFAIHDFRHQIWDGDQLVWLSHAPIEPHLLLGGINVCGHLHNGFDTDYDKMAAAYPWLVNSRQHLNACVERTEYRPMTLAELRERQDDRGVF